MYLDTIFAILNEFYPNEINSLKTSQDFCKIDWNSLIKKTKCKNSYDKGKALENLAYYFFNCINDIKITGKNIRCFTEEIICASALILMILFFGNLVQLF